MVGECSSSVTDSREYHHHVCYCHDNHLQHGFRDRDPVKRSS